MKSVNLENTFNDVFMFEFSLLYKALLFINKIFSRLFSLFYIGKLKFNTVYKIHSLKIIIEFENLTILIHFISDTGTKVIINHSSVVVMFDKQFPLINKKKCYLKVKINFLFLFTSKLFIFFKLLFVIKKNTFLNFCLHNAGLNYPLQYILFYSRVLSCFISLRRKSSLEKREFHRWEWYR